jgi:hypothetical protein
MKLSNRVRWVLVLPAIIATFVAESYVATHVNQPGLNNDSVAVAYLIIAVLTGIIVAPLQGLRGKRFITFMAVLFILTCLFPPWQFTADRNGKDGFHSRKPAEVSFLLTPPISPDRTVGNGVQIDFGRLILEWVALAAVTGMVWLFVVKSARSSK